MRDSYLPLRRAGSIRPRPIRVADRWVVLAVAGAILLLQGASLDRSDEVAQAEPLAIVHAGSTAPVDQAERPRIIATSDPTPALLASPREVISCTQPPVGTFASGDAGCMRATLGDAPAEEPAPVVAATASAPSVIEEPASAAAIPMLPPFVATMPPLQSPPSANRMQDATGMQDGQSPTVTAAITDRAAAMPSVRSRREPATRDAVMPANAAIRLKALDQVLVGRWVPRTDVCRRGRTEECLPLTVGRVSAKAGSASCRFTDMVREGTRWKATASCRNESDRWTAHVRLSLAGKRLTWTSERGTQDYSR